MPAPSSIDSDANVNIADKTTAIKNAVRAHRYGELLFFSCFVFFKSLSSNEKTAYLNR